MHALREFVFDVGVRGHFAAALCASPILGGAQESGANALAAVMSLYRSTFHITYGPGFVAAVGARSKACFEKSDESAVVLFSDENN
jgi:hypothetical protein